MRGVMIFDGLNDIVFMKNNETFSRYIRSVAVLQGLISEEDEGANDVELGADVVMQLFSPLITSQRVMLHHFSNPYSEIKCYDGLNIVFNEYIGYLFVSVGYACTHWLRRYLCVFISIIKHTCGPDVSKLKTDNRLEILVGRLLSTWCCQMATEQSVLVEAVEQLRVPPSAASACLKNLTEAAEKIKSELSVSQVHAFIMVHHRFLSLYSSRNASELFFSDVLLLSLIGEAVRAREDGTNEVDYEYESHLEASVDRPSYAGLAERNDTKTDAPDKNARQKDAQSIQKNPVRTSMKEFVFLLGKQNPHAVHIHHITPYLSVFLIHEIGHEHTHRVLLESLHSLCALQDLHARGTTDREVMLSCVEVTDGSIKILNESFKKKVSGITKTHLNSIKTASKKWEIVKKQYQDYWRSRDIERLHNVDSAIENIILLFRNIYSNCLTDISLTYSNRKVTVPILPSVRKTFQNLIEISSTLDTSNLTSGAKSALSINKYLEEFPGMVHFMYIDRVTHRFVAPNLEFSSQETIQLTREKIWRMVQFAWSHLHEGRTAVMWKDTVFNYSYFLWFEDTSGTPIKPKICPTTIAKTLLPPGILNGDFYRHLVKKCFPMVPANKIRCYELFSLHLGLVTSSCVLEQCRRLTATIWEVTGTPTNPLDLL